MTVRFILAIVSIHIFFKSFNLWLFEDNCKLTLFSLYLFYFIMNLRTLKYNFKTMFLGYYNTNFEYMILILKISSQKPLLHYTINFL